MPNEPVKNEPVKNEPVVGGEGKVPLVNINKEKYSKQRSPSGGSSLSNGDDVAQAIQGLPVGVLYEVCDKLFKDNDFLARYSQPTETRDKPLNVGMQRMNLGNKIRGWVNGRDKANDALVAEGKDPKASGIDTVIKLCAPSRKIVDKEAAEAEKAKEAKTKAAAEKKETEAKKKAHNAKAK